MSGPIRKRNRFQKVTLSYSEKDRLEFINSKTKKKSFKNKSKNNIKEKHKRWQKKRNDIIEKVDQYFNK